MSEASLLLKWYRSEQRDLPWRRDRDPYRIWISEVMLQQTTVRAVVPYYERFISRFPSLASLSQAQIGDVLELWAGLGYYSRARNLHASAQALVAGGGFPRTYREFLLLPGFGPYTSRAVSSIAFDEPVGVLDGNVIRVLCRLSDLKVKWWLPRVRSQLQILADEFVSSGPSSELNQALMELGATICTTQTPACMLCPLKKTCQARIHHAQKDSPLKRPRRQREIWAWRPVLTLKRGRIAFVKNTYAPFLKGQLIYPGKVQRLKQRPKTFDFRHSVTHHDIFVKVRIDPKAQLEGSIHWLAEKKLAKIIPLALVQKALEHSRGKLK